MAHRAIGSALWWLCLLVAPLVLLGIELFHPANFTAHPGMYAFLSHAEPYRPQFHALAYPGPDWWFMLHMIQTPMVGLVAVGLWLLVEPADDGGAAATALAWLARAAAFVFLIYYTALDAIGGIGLGRTILLLQHLAAAGTLNAEQVKGAELLLDAMWVDPWVGGVGSFISQAGSWAAFVATAAAALALLVARAAPWPALALLVAFGWELQISHASMHGPTAFALLSVAAIWIGRDRHRRQGAAGRA
jgi:hypothetical protein